MSCLGFLSFSLKYYAFTFLHFKQRKKAEPGKLDINRREPGILFISLTIVSLAKP